MGRAKTSYAVVKIQRVCAALSFSKKQRGIKFLIQSILGLMFVENGVASRIIDDIMIDSLERPSDVFDNFELLKKLASGDKGSLKISYQNDEMQRLMFDLIEKSRREAESINHSTVDEEHLLFVMSDSVYREFTFEALNRLGMSDLEFDFMRKRMRQFFEHPRYPFINRRVNKTRLSDYFSKVDSSEISSVESFLKLMYSFPKYIRDEMSNEQREADMLKKWIYWKHGYSPPEKGPFEFSCAE